MTHRLQRHHQHSVSKRFRGKRVSTFFVGAELAHPQSPERRLRLELLVDTGATWTLLPAEVVNELGLAPSWQRTVTLANGERVT